MMLQKVKSCCEAFLFFFINLSARVFHFYPYLQLPRRNLEKWALLPSSWCSKIPPAPGAYPPCARWLRLSNLGENILCLSELVLGKSIWSDKQQELASRQRLGEVTFGPSLVHVVDDVLEFLFPQLKEKDREQSFPEGLTREVGALGLPHFAFHLLCLRHLNYHPCLHTHHERRGE